MSCVIERVEDTIIGIVDKNQFHTVGLLGPVVPFGYSLPSTRPSQPSLK
jgi:hypothetical protein